jgi:ABC-type bacteriocin/lantibiotic exporter with double-glycine peptidase domain
MTTDTARMRRKFLIPEVVQTSTMDCGPATIKCLMEGFGTHISYGRLREACQTSIDGTSIDKLEEVTTQLGLEAEQAMLPPEHLLLPEAHALPAIVVVLSGGVPHFVIAWRYDLGFIQVMDPVAGRRWLTPKQYREWLCIHTLAVPATGWRQWAGSEESLRCLQRRLEKLKLSRVTALETLNRALADQSWKSVAALYAATSMAESMIRSAAITRGRQSAQFMQSLFARFAELGESEIGRQYWPVVPHPGGGRGQLLLRGAVLVRVSGRSNRRAAAEQANPVGNETATLRPELAMALEEAPSRPLHDLFRFLREDGLLAPAVLVKASFLAAAVVLIKALLFRSLLDIGNDLALTAQRAAAVGYLTILLIASLMLSLSIAGGVLRLGRHLESRLRVAILDKLPRLDDWYFRSRLTSDMAERSHSVHALRTLPNLGGQLIGSVFQLIMTTVGVIWLAPSAALIAVTAAVLATGLPLIAQSTLAERDLRVRNHLGALSRFYLDTLLGLMPVRAHAAERAVRRQHESLLIEWAHAALGLQRLAVAVGALQSLVGFTLAIWLLLTQMALASEAGSILLLIYWSLSIPALGQSIASALLQYPNYRNVALRLMEPLGAPEAPTAPFQTDFSLRFHADEGASPPFGGGLAMEKAREIAPHRATEAPLLSRTDAAVGNSNIVATSGSGVTIRIVDLDFSISGHAILRRINLSIDQGSHVAIVGPSGAGKSSLAGILLGWNKPSTGTIFIDGTPLDAQHIKRLRQETAWVDPTVQLWNRSLTHNLLYGASDDSIASLGRTIESADLRNLLNGLPDGLQTSLGEGGALVSGGEGQRVRLGRAMLRDQARLVILDEPFTGLDRPRREYLLKSAREIWKNATLLYITHDIDEASGFERVLVIEEGRIVEDGGPSDLVQRSDSRYAMLLKSETDVRSSFMSSMLWRHMRLEKKTLVETERDAAAPTAAEQAAQPNLTER